MSSLQDGVDKINSQISESFIDCSGLPDGKEVDETPDKIRATGFNNDEDNI